MLAQVLCARGQLAQAQQVLESIRERQRQSGGAEGQELALLPGEQLLFSEIERAVHAGLAPEMNRGEGHQSTPPSPLTRAR